MATNPLELTDEQIDNMSLEELAKLSEGTDDPETFDQNNDEELDDADLGEESSEDAVSNESDSSDSVDEEDGEEDSSETTTEEQEDTPKDSDTESKETETTDVEDKDTTSEIQYKEVYEKIFAPFQANGHQIQAKNVDDVLTLMKMGANYNKKMQGLKPVLKVARMLENNDLMDEGKLSYLIDLSKKNPEAIKKLVKESGVDPLDIDPENASEYVPKTYAVSDQEVELDGILDSIKDSTAFPDTLDIITNKLDATSKRVLLENPNLITVINSHVEKGIYKKVMDGVASERAMGRLVGLSDLDAYKQVGDTMQAAGAFGEPETKQPNANDQSTAKKAPKEDPKLMSKKKAAGVPRAKPSTQKSIPKDFNPLDLSDEEFDKQFGSKLL